MTRQVGNTDTATDQTVNVAAGEIVLGEMIGGVPHQINVCDTNVGNARAIVTECW